MSWYGYSIYLVTLGIIFIFSIQISYLGQLVFNNSKVFMGHVLYMFALVDCLYRICIIYLEIPSAALLGVGLKGILSYHTDYTHHIGVVGLFPLGFQFHKVFIPTPWYFEEFLGNFFSTLGVSSLPEDLQSFSLCPTSLWISGGCLLILDKKFTIVGCLDDPIFWASDGIPRYC